MDILSTLFSQPSRKIGLLVPDVVISEKHQDQLEITEHPVEIGAEIADHAYKRPVELTMEVGFAGGGSLLDLWDTAKIGLSLGLSPRETYQKLLELQASRQPFDVITGKRQYSNMLIRAIEVTTDKASENVLMAVLTLRELNMTRTETATVTRQANMREGATTSGVANTGVKTTKPVENVSLLQRGRLDARYAYASGAPVITGIPLLPGQDLLAQYAWLNPDGRLIVIEDDKQSLDAAGLGKTAKLYWITD